MMVALRLLTALGIALLLGNAALAQPATAPPPHRALDEFVKEYQRLELPLPPQNAELVRINRYRFWAPPEEPITAPYILAWRVPSAKPGDHLRYLQGSYSGSGFWDEWYEAAAVEAIAPTPDALREIGEVTSGYWLSLAVHCQLRGWTDLARAAYTLARAKEVKDDYYQSEIVELHEIAWMHWVGKLSERMSDRKEVLVWLKKLIREEPHLQTARNARILSCLETTVGARKAKPGSVEALIDELTEYSAEYDSLPNRLKQESYAKLVELGFDAVPALIEHLNDDRLSRAYSEGFNNFFPFLLTVGHLCSRILFDLSARTIGGGYWQLRGDRVDPDEARKWFEQTKKIGEEKWLVDHAIPTDGGKTIVNQSGRPEPLIVRVIAAKYPERIPAIYREMLKKPVMPWMRDYVEEIVASKLPREKKVALLLEGVTHDDLDHRAYALKGISALDPTLFRKHVLLTLKEAEAKLDAKQNWCDSSDFITSIDLPDDQECWDVFTKLTKKSPFAARMHTIFCLVPSETRPDQFDPLRRERLRLLTQLLDDQTAEPDDSESWSMVEVRDYAAAQLAGLLGFKVRRRIDDYAVFPDRTMSCFSRFILRVAVRQAAERELATKPKQ